MKEQEVKIQQERYLEPSSNYTNLMKEFRQRKFTPNDIKSFVYRIFAMYERATCEDEHLPAEAFKPYVSSDVRVDFPNYPIAIDSWEKFAEWHRWIHNLLESDDHHIDQIRVELLKSGKYEVRFDVRWRGLFKDGTYLDNIYAQIWILREEEGKSHPVIERYIARDNDPMIEK
ncbi:MAG: hypothetical protein N4A49_02660 [Marinifilaceae bacterium]|jgi:hypothetical protein|nr:hypothetical protein [Marinifilaceae bacterium]